MTWVGAALGFHENRGLQQVARRPFARLVTWAAASGLLLLHGVTLLGPLAIGLIFVWPERRRLILSVAAVGMILDRYLVRQELDLSASSLAAAVAAPGPWLKVLAATCAIVLGLYLIFLFAKNLHRAPAPVRQHPYLMLHSGVFSLFGLIYLFPPLAALAEIVPWLLWRVCFLIQFATRGRMAATKFSDHLFYLWPMVGTHGSPYGKGLAYLSSREAEDDEAFAASRLAGLKLLLLATLWEFVLRAFDMLVYGSPKTRPLADLGFNLGLPTLEQAIASGDTGIVMAWISIFVELIRIVLYYAVTGHVIVGFLRVCGFNIFRNTYKPLLSESIIEYWGRFNYYFKELMVEFFFYPTFLAARRLNTHLRLLLAVFAAAFLGNMYYHVLGVPEPVAAGDFQAVWAIWGPRLVYCLLLTLGIWVSMLRQQTARQKSTEKSTLARLRSICGVWVFYAVIHIWNLYGEDLTWANRAEFSLKLIGF